MIEKSHRAYLEYGSDSPVWPSFDDIQEPRMVCFGIGNGSGSKLFQSYLDGHPQIYMVPGYQLMYLYPHWHEWQEEFKDGWTWETIIDALCVKHASLLDSRRIPGHDGLTTLGETQDQYIQIDESLFRAFLTHLLRDRPVNTRDLILAVHYAYAFAKGEDLNRKTVLVYHLHVYAYARYLLEDFPEMLKLGFVRDPRSNIKGRYKSEVAIDREKLNATDAVVLLRRTFISYWRFHIGSLEALRNLDPARVRMVRHEDMHHRLDELMHATAQFLGIDFDPCMLNITFGGLKWWGDKVYDMKPMNKPNPRVISLQWRNELPWVDWFVLEGLGFDYCQTYGYEPQKYVVDNTFNRIKLFLALFWPFGFEWWIFRRYLNLGHFAGFVRASIDEASGRTPLKDYRFNAFYRHKWCNRGFKLHIVPWYRRFLLFTEGETLRSSAFPSIPALFPLARWTYVSVNISRYLFSTLVFPLIVFKRALLSIEPFLRMIKKTEVLPRPMI